MLHYNAPGEHTVLVVRKHWFILLRDTIEFVVLFFVPFILYELAVTPNIISNVFGFSPLALPPLDPETAVLFKTMWGLFIWVKLFGVWTNYYLDVWIITDKRIVAIDQIRFFSRHMSVCRLERVQDIAVDVHGIIATMLNFGDLVVQTAGAEKDFTIKGIPRPQQVKDSIMREHDKTVDHSATSGV